MEYANCTVRLAGQMTFEVQKVGVTPAEIMVLRALHGQDSVINIVSTGIKKGTAPATERARLLGLYTANGAKEEYVKLINDMFPGAYPRIPLRIADVMTDADLIEPEAPADDGDLDPIEAAPVEAAAEPTLEDPDAEAIEDAEPTDYSFLNNPEKKAEIAAAAKNKRGKAAASAEA